MRRAAHGRTRGPAAGDHNGIGVGDALLDPGRRRWSSKYIVSRPSAQRRRLVELAPLRVPQIKTWPASVLFDELDDDAHVFLEIPLAASTDTRLGTPFFGATSSKPANSKVKR